MKVDENESLSLDAVQETWQVAKISDMFGTECQGVVLRAQHSADLDLEKKTYAFGPK